MASVYFPCWGCLAEGRQTRLEPESGCFCDECIEALDRKIAALEPEQIERVADRVEQVVRALKS